MQPHAVAQLTLAGCDGAVSEIKCGPKQKQHGSCSVLCGELQSQLQSLEPEGESKICSPQKAAEKGTSPS